VPRSVLATMRHGGGVRIHPLPMRLARVTTALIRRRGEHAPAIDALQDMLRSGRTGRTGPRDGVGPTRPQEAP
jgi:hypothetical protein